MASPNSESPTTMVSNSLLVLPLHVTEEPTVLPSSGTTVQLDLTSLNGTDENLADLQPEPEEEGESRGGWDGLMDEQKKLEYMSCLGLVPPAVLEEIHRRQSMCKSEYGNWWDRLHSTDFCLVPKSDSSLQSLHMLNCEGEGEGMGEAIISETGYVGVGEDVTQVAPCPDAGALVEQITYLTSWPQATPPDAGNSVEIITQPATVAMENNDVTTISGEENNNMLPQTLRDHYTDILTDQSADQASNQLHHALHHITTYR